MKEDGSRPLRRRMGRKQSSAKRKHLLYAASKGIVGGVHSKKERKYVLYAQTGNFQVSG